MNNQFVLGWGLITAAFFGGATFAWAAESIGGAEIVVNEVKGNLTAGKVVSVLRGDDVYREEGVKTSADSTAKLVLRDNTILTVGPGSFVKLDKFVYDHPGSAGAISLNLTKGTLRFVTGLALKSSYSVTTPTAALGLRGTIFTLEATRIKTTVTLNEGAMDVCMKAFRHKCVILDHPGQQATVTATVVALVPDPPSAPSVGGILGALFGTPAPAAHAPAAHSAAPAAHGGAATAAASAGASAGPGAASAGASAGPGAASAGASAGPGAAAGPGAGSSGATGAPGGGSPGGGGPGPGGPGPGGVGNGQGNGNGNGVGEGGNNGHGHNGNGNGNGNGTGNGNGNGNGTGHGGGNGH